MKRGQLRDYFAGVGVKRLSGVDSDRKKSNQHEVNTTREMREQFLGEQHERFSVVYMWLGEDQDGFSLEDEATHYDTRAKKPRRQEWRLYYSANAVTDAMGEGDTLFLALDRSRRLYFIVAPQGSTSEQQLFWLFNLRPAGRSFVSRAIEDEEPELDFAARFILDELGVEFEDPDADRLDAVVEQYGTAFPKTAEFSQRARLTLPDVRAEDDPDAALLAWLTHEEALFRRLERRIVSARIEDGFVDEIGTDVDAFVKFSLSVHNRRKSRMGYSLENHLEAVFDACGVRYARGKVTEHNHRPDFLFPSIEAYRAAPATGTAYLAMLGAKSTCKERWRQVLTEAAKIPRKHLLTLEPGITANQTDQMESENLQLVVPEPIQASYSDEQQAWLWSLGDFIRDVDSRARR